MATRVARNCRVQYSAITIQKIAKRHMHIIIINIIIDESFNDMSDHFHYIIYYYYYYFHFLLRQLLLSVWTFLCRIIIIIMITIFFRGQWACADNSGEIRSRCCQLLAFTTFKWVLCWSMDIQWNGKKAYPGKISERGN